MDFEIRIRFSYHVCFLHHIRFVSVIGRVTEGEERVAPWASHTTRHAHITYGRLTLQRKNLNSKKTLPLKSNKPNKIYISK